MPENRLKRGLRATFIGLTANALLTSAKFATGILGHSHALMADAVPSAASTIIPSNPERREGGGVPDMLAFPDGSGHRNELDPNL